jgi:hypothetical protein
MPCAIACDAAIHPAVKPRMNSSDCAIIRLLACANEG